MEKIINALLDGICKLGLEATLAPQTAAANRPQIKLYLAGIEPAGINRKKPDAGKSGWEKIIFNAEFTSNGTHARWVTDTILALRKIVSLNDAPMRLAVKADKVHYLDACWKRLTPGRFEYPEEEKSSMPVRYVELWEVSVAYPAYIIELSHNDGSQEES
jgi:hypothetical protein